MWGFNWKAGYSIKLIIHLTIRIRKRRAWVENTSYKLLFSMKFFFFILKMNVCIFFKFWLFWTICWVIDLKSLRYAELSCKITQNWSRFKDCLKVKRSLNNSTLELEENIDRVSGNFTLKFWPRSILIIIFFTVKESQIFFKIQLDLTEIFLICIEFIIPVIWFSILLQ